jgi:archaellum biogenesis protein FlaJ (TadC family)
MEKAQTESHHPGLTPFDTALYFFSLIYPFVRETDNQSRIVFIWLIEEERGVVLEKKAYPDLSKEYRKEIKEVEKIRRRLFYLTLVILAASFFISLTAFKVLLGIVLLVTLGYTADRRIKFLWLKREYEKFQRKKM